MLPNAAKGFNFDLGETADAIRETVRDFAQEKIAPRAEEIDRTNVFPRDLWPRMGELGLHGITVEEEYGGTGLGYLEHVIAMEEISRASASVGLSYGAHSNLCVNQIRRNGNEAQKRKYLPKLISGEHVGSLAMSEPNAGSDVVSMATRAEKKGDRFIINGSKMWITNSKEAGFFIVFANMAPEKGYKGITAFVMPKDTKGLTIAKKEKKLGIKASSTCVLNFDDVDVPHDALLGEEGQGYKYAIGLLNEGRIGIAAQMTGLALGAFSNAANYVWNDRKQFGSLVGEFQGMQFQLAQAYTEICAARALVYNAARKKEAGEDFVRDAAMAKLYASQVAGKVSGQAIEWMGGMGFVREGLAEKYWRDSKIGQIYEGTSNIQLSTIARLTQREYTK